MRIQEGDYAYELEQKIDPATQLRQQWQYSIYLMFPAEQILEKGEAETREEAESRAQAAIARLRREAKKASSAA